AAVITPSIEVAPLTPWMDPANCVNNNAGNPNQYVTRFASFKNPTDQNFDACKPAPMAISKKTGASVLRISTPPSKWTTPDPHKPPLFTALRANLADF
ncbi:MAG: hypothetical protein EBU32_14050, partial [Opitutaceae bacterium]|nr:hypothetical protein [Opitutaceae bacterium]